MVLLRDSHSYTSTRDVVIPISGLLNEEIGNVHAQNEKQANTGEDLKNLLELGNPDSGGRDFTQFAASALTAKQGSW